MRTALVANDHRRRTGPHRRRSVPTGRRPAHPGRDPVGQPSRGDHRVDRTMAPGGGRRRSTARRRPARACGGLCPGCASRSSATGCGCVPTTSIPPVGPTRTASWTPSVGGSPCPRTATTNCCTALWDLDGWADRATDLRRSMSAMFEQARRRRHRPRSRRASSFPPRSCGISMRIRCCLPNCSRVTGPEAACAPTTTGTTARTARARRVPPIGLTGDTVSTTRGEHRDPARTPNRPGTNRATSTIASTSASS